MSNYVCYSKKATGHCGGWLLHCHVVIMVDVALFQLVQLLLRHGANPLAKNSDGESPLDVASAGEVTQLLRSEIIASSSSDDDYDVRSPTSPESDVNDLDTDPTPADMTTQLDDDKHSDGMSCKTTVTNAPEGGTQTGSLRTWIVFRRISMGLLLQSLQPSRGLIGSSIDFLSNGSTRPCLSCVGKTPYSKEILHK